MQIHVFFVLMQNFPVLLLQWACHPLRPLLALDLDNSYQCRLTAHPVLESTSLMTASGTHLIATPAGPIPGSSAAVWRTVFAWYRMAILDWCQMVVCLLSLWELYDLQVNWQREEWRSAGTTSGGQFVVLAGMTRMLQLFAGSSEFSQVLQFYYDISKFLMC